MKTGQFVTFVCGDSQQFQARASDDAKSVRVCALHGSAELEQKGDGRYAGEGYMLRTRGGDAVSLEHWDKSQGKRAARFAPEIDQ